MRTFTLTPIKRFTDLEASSGIALLVATAAALVWANSPWQDSYTTFWHASLGGDIGPIHLPGDVLHWVNDGLMALFFFVVGLEIKREWVSGELQDNRVAALPAIAALGGMVLPALLFLAIASGTEAANGWGVPMATDIAFALGVVALLGDRVPSPLKVFLLTLAIVDDIGAILVIAVAYTDHVAMGWLAGAGLVVATIVVLRRLESLLPLLYLLLGIALWVCALNSGIHPTIAGVVLGLLAPSPATGVRLEEGLHPWTSNLIVPIFALGNAGIVLSADVVPGGRPLAAVVIGLVVGKAVGVTGGAWIATKLGIAELPAGVRWSQIAGVGALAGIGFTVAIFVTGLAFDNDLVESEVKLGVLVASVIAAALGSVLLAALRWETSRPSGRERGPRGLKPGRRGSGATAGWRRRSVPFAIPGRTGRRAPASPIPWPPARFAGSARPPSATAAGPGGVRRSGHRGA